MLKRLWKWIKRMIKMAKKEVEEIMEKANELAIMREEFRQEMIDRAIDHVADGDGKIVTGVIVILIGAAIAVGGVVQNKLGGDQNNG